jgi:hypothetical protein
VFFSEEKYLCAALKIPAMASILPLAQTQKSFASFLQKRRIFLRLPL